MKNITQLNSEISAARARAVERCRLALTPAIEALRLLGSDNETSRALARKICGLPADSMGGYVTLRGVDSLIGCDANGGRYVKDAEILSPADLDATMREAKKLVRAVVDGILAYMAGKAAETAEIVRQFDASAQLEEGKE